MYNPREQVTLDGALEGVGARRLWLQHLRKQWPVYLGGTLAVVGTDLCEALFPKLTQMAIDLFSGSHQEVYREAARWGWNWEALGRSGTFRLIFVIMMALIAIQFVGRIGWRVTLAQQTHYAAARFKKIIWNRARYFPRRRLDTDLSAGELMNVATGDVGMGRYVYGFTLTGTIDFIFLLLFTACAMFSVDRELTLWSLAILPTLPPLLNRLAKRESRFHGLAQDSLSELTDLSAQAVATVRLQRLTQTGSFWQKKLGDAARDYRAKRLDVIRAGLSYIPATGFAPLVSYLILLALGLRKVFAHELSLGGFVAMQSYIFIIQGPLFELGVITSEWQRCFTSLHRVSRTLAQPEAEGLREGGAPVQSASTVFALHHLRFAYAPGSEVIRDLSLEMREGERLGIRGPIGSGKSTLLNLLAGFERDFGGELKLYGRDVREYNHFELRRSIALVPQKPFLFADTLRANLRLDREMSDEEIWRWLEVACLREDVERFPRGLDTRLGEWGINLSGGQKQRLTLARALAAQPRILLLDDCLSAVDTVTEEKILAHLDVALGQVTAVWVAHRSSTLRYCDQIIEMPPARSAGELSGTVA